MNVKDVVCLTLCHSRRWASVPDFQNDDFCTSLCLSKTSKTLSVCPYGIPRRWLFVLNFQKDDFCTSLLSFQDFKDAVCLSLFHSRRWASVPIFAKDNFCPSVCLSKTFSLQNVPMNVKYALCPSLCYSKTMGVRPYIFSSKTISARPFGFSRRFLSIFPSIRPYVRLWPLYMCPHMPVQDARQNTYSKMYAMPSKNNSFNISSFSRLVRRFSTTLCTQQGYIIYTICYIIKYNIYCFCTTVANILNCSQVCLFRSQV